MVRINTVQIRRSAERVKDKKAPLDDLGINMNFSQMLKGKEQAVQEQKPDKEDGLCKTEEADSIKKEPASIPLQTDEGVQNPAETMVQLQAAFNQMLENVVNHTPDSELTNQEQPEPPLETGGTFAAVAATDVRPERMTAAKAGDRRMPDYVELKAESSLHTMKPRAFLPDREAEASERDWELSQAGFARVDKEMQPVILRDEHSGHQEAADGQKPSFKGNQYGLRHRSPSHLPGRSAGLWETVPGKSHRLCHRRFSLCHPHLCSGYYNRCLFLFRRRRNHLHHGGGVHPRHHE